jgi:putative glutamine amidotransferase
MPKPLIGLTTTRTSKTSRTPKYGVNELYAKALSNAGALPVLIPLNISNDDLDSLINHLDGILFTGGNDIDPCQYGNQPHPKVEGIDKERDRVEIHLVKKMIRSGKPIMGICRGFQLINVALGGSLYEHLPEQFPGNVIHDNHNLPRNFMAHSVRVEPDNRLSRIFSSKQAEVNSLHHQGVHKLAQELLPAAYAPDGLVEAFELPGFSFGIAVQWHPEELLANAGMRKLFEEFVQSCQVDNSL